MKTEEERLVEILDGTSFDIVRRSFIERSKTERMRVGASRLWMSEHGYEEIEIADGRLLSDDGREIVFAHKKKWVLNSDEWAKRWEDSIAKAVAEKEQSETKSVAGTDSASGLLCPTCGDIMMASSVCPACAVGRAGYKMRYSCVCGVEFVSKSTINIGQGS